MESPRQAGGSGAGAAKHDSIRADACSSILSTPGSTDAASQTSGAPLCATSFGVCVSYFTFSPSVFSRAMA
jgi:hypothetical protein